MKILIVHSTSSFQNLGDVAMLQTAVRRLREQFPGAELHILAEDTESFPLHLPNEISYPREGYYSFLYGRMLPLRRAWLPSQVADRIDRLECMFRERFPRAAHKLIKLLARPNRIDPEIQDRFMTALLTSDALVVTGAGSIADQFPLPVRDILGVVRVAQRLGKITAMLGQGLGPFTRESSRQRIASVVRNLELLTMREKRAGIPLLESMNLPMNNVQVTGDDAIEMGYAARRSQRGEHLGLNLRIGESSGLSADSLPLIRRALAGIREKLGVNCVPLPIYVGSLHEDDHKSIARAADGVMPIAEGFQGRVTTVPELIDRVSFCRAVLTGSYHGGVFALAQGTPVVAMVKNDYYRDKFEGLADQFPGGCKVVYLDSDRAEEDLFRAVLDAWNQTDECRRSLLKSAEEQIALSRGAYAQLRTILGAQTARKS